MIFNKNLLPKRTPSVRCCHPRFLRDLNCLHQADKLLKINLTLITQLDKYVNVSWNLNCLNRVSVSKEWLNLCVCMYVYMYICVFQCQQQGQLQECVSAVRVCLARLDYVIKVHTTTQPPLPSSPRPSLSLCLLVFVFCIFFLPLLSTTCNPFFHISLWSLSHHHLSLVASFSVLFLLFSSSCTLLFSLPPPYCPIFSLPSWC